MLLFVDGPPTLTASQDSVQSPGVSKTEKSQ